MNGDPVSTDAVDYLQRLAITPPELAATRAQLDAVLVAACEPGAAGPADEDGT
ncbi:hypothetical protein ACWDE0_40765 [Streptomyces sp. 900105755]